MGCVRSNIPNVFLLSLSLAAEPVDPFTEPDETDLFMLEERIITVASRYAQTARQAPAIVTVYTDAELRERGCRTLSDALRMVPGVYLSTSPEGRTLGWVRGVTAPDNNKILILVDGVPWYDGVYTHAWLDEYIPLSMVKQVEIIKGPGSAIYGTNAFAGVINIVTYSPEDLKGGFVRAEAGTAFRRDVSVVAGNQLPGREASVMAYARWHDSIGDGEEYTPRGRRDVHGSDPITSVNAGFRLDVNQWRLTVDHVDYEHTYLTQDQNELLDVLFQSKDEYNLGYRNEFVSLSRTFKPNRDLSVTPRLYWQDHDNPGLYGFVTGIDVTEDPDTGELSADLGTVLIETAKHSRRYGGALEYQVRPAAGHVNVGGVGVEAVQIVELWDDTYSGGETTRGFTAPNELIVDAFVYTQHTWTALYWLELTGGFRADYNFTANYPFLSPRLGILMVPTDAMTAKLLFGQAFRAPTARELLVTVDMVDDDFPFTAGNRRLDPEIIRSAEFELTYDPTPWLQLRGATFLSLLTNTIDKGTQLNQYVNRGGANIFGTELGALAQTGPVETELSWSWTRGRVQDGALNSEGDLLALPGVNNLAIYEFPGHMGHARLRWQAAEGLQLTAMVDAYGYRPRWEWARQSGLNDGQPFALVGLAASTSTLAGGRVRADVSVHNLLDTPYQTLIYVDDVNAVNTDDEGNITGPKYPNDIDGEGRFFNVGVEVSF